MKKLILIASGVVFCAAASFAQTDTTRSQTPVQTPTQQTPQQSDQLRDDMKGWSKVETADVPASLRTTLSNQQYAGWETGTLYKNTAGDTYSWKSADGKNTLYFDKNGKATTKPNKKGN